MRRVVLLLLFTLAVAASCGRSPTSSAEAAPTTSIQVTTTAAAVTTTTNVGSTSTASTASTAAPVDVVLPSGREALAAAEGTPHALWFWGAH